MRHYDYDTIQYLTNETGISSIDDCKTIGEVKALLKESGYKYHHSALSNRRYNIGDVDVRLYDGKFGRGITVHEHMPRQQGNHKISYYIREEKKA